MWHEIQDVVRVAWPADTLDRRSSLVGTDVKEPYEHQRSLFTELWSVRQPGGSPRPRGRWQGAGTVSPFPRAPAP